MCIMRGRGRLSGFVWVITPTFMHGFQTYFDTVVVLEEEKCHLNNFFR